MAKSPDQDEQDKRQAAERERGEAEVRARARADQPEPGSAAARQYGTAPTSVGETQPQQPEPPPVPEAPRAEFPKWKYHKDEGSVVVETKEAEDQRGEGWQDRPVLFGPEDTKGMKVTDEALKKYTDAVYPKGWRDDAKRTDENAIAAAKASREARGIKEGDEGTGKRDELARKEEERAEQDQQKRDQQDKENKELRERQARERQQQAQQQQRESQDQAKKRA